MFWATLGDRQARDDGGDFTVRLSQYALRLRMTSTTV